MATIEKRQSGDGTRYRVRVRLKGSTPRTRTFKRLGDAKAWAAKVESELGRGTPIRPTLDRRRRLADLIDRFIGERLSERRDNAQRRKVAAQLAWWKEHGGHVALDRLTAKTIADLRANLLERRTGRRQTATARSPAAAPIAPSTANRYLAALSVVCQWGWKSLGWLAENPLRSVPRGPEHSGALRCLLDDERAALVAASEASADPNIHTAVVLALATGASAGSLRRLTWDDIDIEHWRLRFVRVRDGRTRYLPVVGPAREALRAHLERDPTGRGWIFKGRTPQAPADLEGAWRKVRAAAGLTGERHIRFHDLRHATATYLTSAGATLGEVAETLGNRAPTSAGTRDAGSTDDSRSE